MAQSDGTGMEISAADDHPVDRAKGLLFFVVGMVLAIAAIGGGIRTRGFIRDAYAAQGVVVALNAGSSHPEIEFTAASGEKISYPQGGMIFGYQKGDRVRVLYYPKDPSAYPCVDDFGALWFGSMLPGVIGLSFLVVGFALLKGSRRALRGAQRPS